MSERVKPFKNLTVAGNNYRAGDPVKIADGLFDGTTRRGQSDSRQRHHHIRCAAECDGLEDPPSAHTTGIASRLAPALRDRVGDKLQGQALSVVVWHGSQSNRHLDIFKELESLRLW